MEIKTKFDVGQEVWAIGRDYQDNDHQWMCYDHAFEILGVFAAATKIMPTPMVSYNLHGVFEHRGNNDLFATRAEAQAECDRLNGEKGETL